MKEFMALLGFGTGMVVGVMLYKHSQEFRKSVDMGEKKMMKSAQDLENKAEDKIEEAEQKIKSTMKKAKRKASKIKEEIKNN